MSTGKAASTRSGLPSAFAVARFAPGLAGQAAAGAGFDVPRGARPNVRFTRASMSSGAKSPITTSVMFPGT